MNALEEITLKLEDVLSSVAVTFLEKGGSFHRGTDELVPARVAQLSCFSQIYSLTALLIGDAEAASPERCSETLNLFLGTFMRLQNESNQHGLHLGLPKSPLASDFDALDAAQSEDNLRISWTILEKNGRPSYQLFVYVKVLSEEEFFGLNWTTIQADDDAEFL